MNKGFQIYSMSNNELDIHSSLSKRTVKQADRLLQFKQMMEDIENYTPWNFIIIHLANPISGNYKFTVKSNSLQHRKDNSFGNEQSFTDVLKKSISDSITYERKEII